MKTNISIKIEHKFWNKCLNLNFSIHIVSEKNTLKVTWNEKISFAKTTIDQCIPEKENNEAFSSEDNSKSKFLRYA